MENKFKEFKQKLSELLIDYNITIYAYGNNERNDVQILFNMPGEEINGIKFDDIDETQGNYINGFGFKVKKISGCPFKSGKKINKVKGITLNKYSGKKAYTFYDDDSVVDIYLCEKIL